MKLKIAFIQLLPEDSIEKNLEIGVGSCKESEMDKCPKELIRFSQLIKGGISAAEFLEEYSNGEIN